MIPYREVKVLDLNSGALGVPPITLMENAGTVLADVIRKENPSGKRVLFICGTGNNGGDGLVAARHLAETCPVHVIILGESMRKDISRRNLALLPKSVTVDRVSVEEAWPGKGYDGPRRHPGNDHEGTRGPGRVGNRGEGKGDNQGEGEWEGGGEGYCQTEWRRSLAMAVGKADIIVDAMLGVGITGSLREPYRSAVEEVNGSGSFIISVDVPTGLGGDPAVEPDITVTFHDIKPGMRGPVVRWESPDGMGKGDDQRKDEVGGKDRGRTEVGGKDRGRTEGRGEEGADMAGHPSGIKGGTCGTIIIADIGIPMDAEKYVGVGDFISYPVPASSWHKGNGGIVLIVGGGPYTGAPALAGLAALRTGSDLVHLAVPWRVHPIIASYSPDLMVHPLGTPLAFPSAHQVSHHHVRPPRNGDHLTPEDVDDILTLAFRAHAVLIGPGLGKHRETVAAVQKLVEELRKPMVIDADAIYALKDVRFGGNTIVTPHATEFSLSFEDSTLGSVMPSGAALSQRVIRELDGEDRKRARLAMTYALTHGVVVVQKGLEDIITDGEHIRFNRTGNAGMTVGGTGDVLAGVLVSLLARGMEPFLAGRIGTYLTGRAGDLAFRRSWYSLTASDVVSTIPRVFQEIFGTGQ